jgi:hypothetical protein
MSEKPSTETTLIFRSRTLYGMFFVAGAFGMLIGLLMGFAIK